MVVISSGIQHMLSQQEKRYRSSSPLWKNLRQNQPGTRLLGGEIFLFACSSYGACSQAMLEFIWATDKETLTLMIFEPCLVLTLHLILSWLQSIPLHPILDFHLQKTRIVVHIKCYKISSLLTWKKDKEVSHNAASGHHNCAICHALCFVCRGKRIEKMLIARWSEELNNDSALSASTRERTLHNL